MVKLLLANRIEVQTMPGDARTGGPEESEFGLGEGMIDPGMRQDRVLPVEQQLWEIAARRDPETLDVSEVPVPRLLPGEEEADRG